MLFTNTLSGGLGGLAGRFGTKLLMPARPYTPSGTSLFNSIKGGWTGLVGGFVQDLFEMGLGQIAGTNEKTVKKNKLKGCGLIFAALVYILFLGTGVDHLFGTLIESLPVWIRTVLMIISIVPFFVMLSLGYDELESIEKSNEG